MNKSYKILSRNQLKYIAMLLMFLDHFALAFLPENTPLWYVLRYVFGRSAFPIFCVLFVQGFFYTKRPVRHMIDCAVFALLSEIPYDGVVQQGWYAQNVMFTWLLGFIMCHMMSYIFDTVKWSKACVYNGVVCLGFAFLATVFCVDYMFVGIFCIYAVYMMMKVSDGNISVWELCLAVALIDGLASATVWTLPAVLLFAFYDTNKYEKQTVFQKYSFYAFYPLHLSVIALLNFFSFFDK